MISSKTILIPLAILFLCITSLRAASVVKVLYTNEHLSSDASKKLLSVGELDFHLEGRALIDYHTSTANGNKQTARFVLKNVKLSDESRSAIKEIQNSSGLGYTLHLSFSDKKQGVNGSGELVVEFTYDSHHINLEYAVSDVMNGNGLLKITLQNKKVLRALDSNHESILRLAHNTCHTRFHPYC